MIMTLISRGSIVSKRSTWIFSSTCSSSSSVISIVCPFDESRTSREGERSVGDQKVKEGGAKFDSVERYCSSYPVQGLAAALPLYAPGGERARSSCAALSVKVGVGSGWVEGSGMPSAGEGAKAEAAPDAETPLLSEYVDPVLDAGRRSMALSLPFDFLEGPAPSWFSPSAPDDTVRERRDDRERDSLRRSACLSFPLPLFPLDCPCNDVVFE